MKLEDTESRLNTKLAAANENLVSARNDVTRYEEKMRGLEDLVKQKETQHFELKGEIAGTSVATKCISTYCYTTVLNCSYRFVFL